MASFGELIDLGAQGSNSPAFTNSLAGLAQQVYNMEKLRLYDIPLANDAKERTAIDAAKAAVDNQIAIARETGQYQPIIGWQGPGYRVNSPFLPPNSDASQFTPVYGPPEMTQQTLASGRLLGTFNGQDTLDKQRLQADTGVRLLQELGRLQSNPFQMEAVARGANAMGLSNSIGAITRLVPGLASFQGNQAQPQSPSLGSVFGYLGGQGGGASANAGAGAGTSTMAGGGAGIGPAEQAGINPNATVTALQNTPVNKWSPQQYFQVKASSPDFLRSAIQAAGLSESDVENTMNKMLPQFNTPKYGQVTAGGSIANAATQ